MGVLLARARLSTSTTTTTTTLMVLVVFLILFLLPPQISAAQRKTLDYNFGPFNSSYYQIFSVETPATISNEALQITPDSAGNYTLSHRSGRILFNHPFKLWDNSHNKNKLASFNSCFLLNVFRVNFSVPGEGIAFFISPDLSLPPPNSHGQYLGLTNSTTDGKSSNRFVAVELDTVKQGFDPDDNHMGLDINSIRSNKTVSLSKYGIQIAPNGTKFYVVWVEYDGVGKVLDVYMSEKGRKKPSKPLLTANLNLRDIVNQYSYFGFAASTGENVELHCVLRWNLTVEMLEDDHGHTSQYVKIGFGVGVPVLVLLVTGLTGLAYYIHKKRKSGSDPKILGTLRSLPGTPREFGFKELTKATNNFDDKHKLGEGGFGVVYRGLLAKENLEIAVKRFSRDNIKSKDDFLAELTIINRLRHKHLVRLLGWCHKNGVLLLVYDYMPNGSLDNHIFRGPETEIKPLGWNLRYKILSGVASALHYLHNEYDQKVLHRDLKASNILLDSNFNARLGDFGLARAIENEKTSYAELEGVPGTMGYIAPECFHTGKATRESDIYGFGAVVLEVVCGQRPWTKIEGFQFLVDWVWSLHREGGILEAVDGRLGGNYAAEEAERLLLLGLACSHPIASERPKTQAVVQVLSGSVAAPQVPPFKPAFVWPSSPLPDSSVLATGSPDTTSITSSHFGSGWSWTPHYVSKDSNFGNNDNSSSSRKFSEV